MSMTKQDDLEVAEDSHPDSGPPARPEVHYTIGSNQPGENPGDVARYLWGKSSFGADLVQANLTKDWEDGVEIVVPDIQF